MTLESRMGNGWQYRASAVGAMLDRFEAARTPYEETVRIGRMPGDTSASVDLEPEPERDYPFADFLRDVSAEVRRATAKKAGIYSDYDEMVKEREHVLVELLGSCSGDDINEIGDALDELYYWADTYDVWLGR